MSRPRLADWIAGPNVSNSTRDVQSRDVGLLLNTLRAHVPGQWSSNIFELSRHFTSATFLAVNTLAKHAMDSKFSLHEKVDSPDAPNGEIELPWHDPACRLFENPNPEDTFSDLMYQTVQQLSLTGIGCVWNVPSRYAEEPGELYSLPTCTLWPMPPTPEMPHGAYRATPYAFGYYGVMPSQSAQGAIIPAEQIVRVKNHHPYLRYDGYAVLTAIARQVDTLESIDLARFNTMAQGCDQTLALESNAINSQDPSPEDLVRLRKQLELIYAGPKNAGKIWIPPVGWKLSKIATEPVQMAYQEGWSQVLDFILAAFGVPKAVAGLQDSVNYATLYSSLRAFCLFSLGPVVRQIARGWNKRIVVPAWGPEIGLRIICPEFTDETLEETKIANNQKSGIQTVEEMRKMRGYDHLDEPWTKERAIASYSPQSATGGDNGAGGKPNAPESNGPRANAPGVDNARPEMSKSARVELLANAFEKAKVNGHAHPIRN